MKYKRILLKLSGEVLTGNNKYGIDHTKLSEYAKEIKDVKHFDNCIPGECRYWEKVYGEEEENENSL